MTSKPLEVLHALFDAALAAVSAERCLPPHVPGPAGGRTIVVGAGKAAAAMAQVFERQFSGRAEGLVVVPDAHADNTTSIEVLDAGHPVPDARSVAASRRVLEAVANLDERDQVVCLLSGGGSSSLCLPPEGIRLEDKQALTRALLKSGAAISEINCVRKHLSQVKGGRVAAACFPAACLTLAISDVPGDDLTLVASGPTSGDSTTRHDALGILDKYGLTGFQSVMDWLSTAQSESPKPGDPRLARTEIRCIAKAADALAAASSMAESLGIEATVLGDDLEGEARELARAHAAQVGEMIARGKRPDCPQVWLSGGETTVKVTGRGRGGRNGEYLLALAIALDGRPGVYALACDTDGIDGVGRNAGAFLSPDMLGLAAAAGVDAQRCLQNNDAYAFFEALNALAGSGPTLTNVNDFRAILMLPGAWDSRHAGPL